MVLNYKYILKIVHFFGWTVTETFEFPMQQEANMPEKPTYEKLEQGAREFEKSDQNGKLSPQSLYKNEGRFRRASTNAPNPYQSLDANGNFISESLHRKMVANIGDVIVIIDQGGINRYKSPNIKRLFGWELEEVVGFNAWDNVHPEDLESTLKFFKSL